MPIRYIGNDPTHLRITILLLATSAAAAGQGSAPAGDADIGPDIPSSGAAALVPASLEVSGTVMVNRQTVDRTAGTVLKGDRIETSSLSAVRISTPGPSVFVPANSCLNYGGDRLSVCNCGSVDVNAMKPISVYFPDRELVVSSPAQGSAFTMSVSGRDLQIMARRGTTEV